MAAKAVTDATSYVVDYYAMEMRSNRSRMLVAAAKAASVRKEEEVAEFAMLSDMQRKVKEMEIQTDILKIEKELDAARRRLFTIRKQQYTQ